jgi:hypothetical protein
VVGAMPTRSTRVGQISCHLTRGFDWGFGIRADNQPNWTKVTTTTYPIPHLSIDYTNASRKDVRKSVYVVLEEALP